MSANHSWTWKTDNGGYRVVCSDCGLADRFYAQHDQRGAEARVRELRNPTPTRVDRIFAKPSGKSNRKARAARKRAKSDPVIKRAEAEITRRIRGMRPYIDSSHPEHNAAQAEYAEMMRMMPFSMGFDPAIEGDASAVIETQPDGTIQVVNSAIFTPPNCYHVGGTEECVPECVIIYGSFHHERKSSGQDSHR